MGTINQFCTPVPKYMFEDSIVNAFLADTNHFFRTALADNHLADGWYPTSPMRLFYCDADEEVSYLNAINAYDNWTAAGAPDLTIQNMGSYGHFACASYAIIAGKFYFDGFKQDCATAGSEAASPESRFSLWPNPAADRLHLRYPAQPGEAVTLQIFDLNGRQVMQRPLSVRVLLKLNWGTCRRDSTRWKSSALPVSMPGNYGSGTNNSDGRQLPATFARLG